MKKQISFSTQGRRADIDGMTIYRMLPNRYADAVGPFVFLDHIAPTLFPEQGEEKKSAGTGAHPHRGIATLSYILQGQDEHFDSRGHYAKVLSGGIQWMNAGNGIIHDENLSPDPHTESRLRHGFQFWINLPSRQKAEAPQYMAIQAEDVPQKSLPEQAGNIKVIVGRFEELASKIPTYSRQFLYHFRLEALREYRLYTESGMEYAAFLPLHDAVLNGTICHAGEFIEFDRESAHLLMSNPADTPMDILLFGGEPYTEPIVAEGPFVMNSQADIAQAYRDYYAGNYGTIQYQPS